MFKLIILIFFTFQCLFSFEINPRIVGGKFAQQNQFPYLVSLRYFGDHNCGGAILNERFILTAAHCVTYEDGSILEPMRLLTIKAGTNLLEDHSSPSVVVREVKNVIVHELYGDDLNDLAILELTAPLEFTPAIQPIQLFDNQQEDILAGAEVLVPGWGRTQPDGVITPILRYTIMQALTQKQCTEMAKFLDTIEVICLKHLKGKGPCEGDSGGPAVHNGQLIGIGSYYITECGGPFPDAYVRISHYIDWIRQHSQI